MNISNISHEENYGNNSFTKPESLHIDCHITFSSKVRLKRFLFFEILEEFDNTVAFSDGVSVILKMNMLYFALNFLIQRYKSYATYTEPSQTAYLLRGIMRPDKLLC